MTLASNSIRLAWPPRRPPVSETKFRGALTFTVGTMGEGVTPCDSADATPSPANRAMVIAMDAMVGVTPR